MTSHAYSGMNGKWNMEIKRVEIAAVLSMPIYQAETLIPHQHTWLLSMRVCG